MSHAFYISEMDSRAAELARAAGCGVETIAFCAAENLENAALIREKRAELSEYPGCVLHAPYYEICPCAIDPLVREISLRRMRQARVAAQALGIGRVVAHSGFLPQVYYPEWFVPKSIGFWRELLAETPDGTRFMIENVLDPEPEALCTLADGVADARLGLCLDVGHANVYGRVPPEEWIRQMGRYIVHVHLSNNDGRTDAHAALNRGGMDMGIILELLDKYAPDAGITVESIDAAACICELKKRGYLC